MTDQPRLKRLNSYRANVYLGGERIGYIVKMFDFGGVAIDPKRNVRVEYFVCPENGGLERAQALGMATAENEAEAIAALMAMREPVAGEAS